MANANIRVDDQLKKDAEHIFEELGLSMSSATNAFYKQVVLNRGIQFELRLPDPFYLQHNLEKIAKSIDQIKQGEFVVKTIEELEALENE